MFSEHIDTCTQSEKEGVYERNAVYCSNTTETNPYVLPFVSSSSSMYYFVLPYVCISCCWVNVAHDVDVVVCQPTYSAFVVSCGITVRMMWESHLYDGYDDVKDS